MKKKLFDVVSILYTDFCIVFLFAASRIRYEITSGNIGGAFAVKNMTGAIYVAGALDYETRKRVSIYIHNVLYMSWKMYRKTFHNNGAQLGEHSGAHPPQPYHRMLPAPRS